MNEQSKAAKRRFNDGAFHTRYFVGDGLDVGCGPDPLSRYVGVFAKMRSCRGWDLKDGDAQLLAGVPDDAYDFLHSAHCLEHLRDPREGLRNWVRVVKPGGHLVVTAPDADLYEGMVFPSRYNQDHKWMFSMGRQADDHPKIVNVFRLILTADDVYAERVTLVRDFWQDSLAHADQTLLPNTESCIEFVLRKHG